MMSDPLRILIVDDEAPARLRLRQLLGDIQPQLKTEVVAEAADGMEALQRLLICRADIVLLDIRMPRMDGLQLALHLGRLDAPPTIIFVTAFDQYAINAFDLNAMDYLLKPVKAERLFNALNKAPQQRERRQVLEQISTLVPDGRSHLRSTERGRVILVPINDILFFRAKLKYVSAHTEQGEFLLEESLNQLEQEYSQQFIRAHRNCLVSRSCILGYERENNQTSEGESGLRLILRNSEQRILVSRRQWSALKKLLAG